jgi:uncharacterized membrane protein YkvA (DUF1232 family)
MSAVPWIAGWRSRVRRLKYELYALYLAYHDPRTPWYARVVVACVVAYAFSPIDLIPDFIPILGYLDDLLLLPLGILLALCLIPTAVMADCRVQAEARLQQGKPVNWVAAVVIVAIWLLLALWTLTGLADWFQWHWYG